MLKVDWFGHGIVLVDVGELHIRYLNSNFLRDTGFSVEAEELIRVIFDDLNAVSLEVHTQEDRWEATATIEIDAWTVVSHAGKGDTLVGALSNLIHDITKA